MLRTNTLIITRVLYTKLTSSIKNNTKMYKYDTILSNTDQDIDKEINLINSMLEKQVDGILFMGGKITEENIKQFKTSSVHVVLAETYDKTNSLASVNIDY